jgi:hypothetical protein
MPSLQEHPAPLETTSTLVAGVRLKKQLLEVLWAFGLWHSPVAIELQVLTQVGTCSR